VTEWVGQLGGQLGHHSLGPGATGLGLRRTAQPVQRLGRAGLRLPHQGQQRQGQRLLLGALPGEAAAHVERVHHVAARQGAEQHGAVEPAARKDTDPLRQ